MGGISPCSSATKAESPRVSSETFDPVRIHATRTPLLRDERQLNSFFSRILVSAAPDLPFAESGKSRRCRHVPSTLPHENPPVARTKTLNRPRIGPHVPNFLLMLVGAERFELPTPCSQNRCATRLRYAPTPSPPYRKEIPLGKFLVHEIADILACRGQQAVRNPRHPQLQTRDDQLEERDVVPEDMVAGSTHSRAKAPQSFRTICPQAIRRARPGSVR